MKTAYPARRNGFEAMEDSLSPLTRALRRFGVGKPMARPTDTPLGAAVLAVEQRERLRGILASGEGLESPSILHTAITVLLVNSGTPVALDDLILVEEGAESEAVAFLEAYLKCGHRFTVAGLSFVVQSGDEMRVFQYRIERTAEGDAALRLTSDDLILRSKGTP
jgi:hypothetical protein